MIGPSSSGPSRPDGSGPADRGRPRPPARRILWISLGVSALLHGAVLFLHPGWSPDLELPAGVEEPRPVAPGGMEVTTLRIVADDEAADDPETEPRDEPDRPVEDSRERDPAEADDAGRAEDAGAEARRRTAAERLRPREGDPRIWAPMDPAMTELTAAERARLALHGRLEAWNDSVLAAREAEARIRDWTHTDGQGRRWGVSPGRLHLGDVTLPLPFDFGTSPWQRERADRRRSDWEEIERGAVEALRRETLEERARAMRERRDRERADSTDSRR